ncbi:MULTISPECIES: hypothetical protein [unclassified Crossiella]|uniref:hypothetical protein n=1 Tax=unclassified Crossiella TaxID=2620835 RepID=UPI001FFFC315|nr:MULTISPECIES: hypothetical protein [unclassified Crossiella]MCK2239250.1 hypothetical protein [Crossiella sp. S99.2]MCK2251181.1 hypothetical protein [Crossiella sp. S99.1]
MQPRQLVARDVVYADLVRRYTEDDEFTELVHAVAAGLGLLVLAAGTRSGIVLAPTEGSVFEIRMDEYARRTSVQNRREEKVLHGLIHLAVAALAFPRPDDLGNDSYVGRVSVDQVDSAVRDACRMLDERAKTAEENHDPPEDAPELERAWRAYLRRPSAPPTRDGRRSFAATHGMIAKALKFLAEQGLMVGVSNEQGGVFRTTPRYQVQVRELAGQRAFTELLELGVVPVTDPGGSLRVGERPE